MYKLLSSILMTLVFCNFAIATENNKDLKEFIRTADNIYYKVKTKHTDINNPNKDTTIYTVYFCKEHFWGNEQDCYYTNLTSFNKNTKIKPSIFFSKKFGHFSIKSIDVYRDDDIFLSTNKTPDYIIYTDKNKKIKVNIANKIIQRLIDISNNISLSYSINLIIPEKNQNIIASVSLASPQLDETSLNKYSSYSTKYSFYSNKKLQDKSSSLSHKFNTIGKIVVAIPTIIVVAPFAAALGIFSGIYSH
ncbi:hypothetical protein QIW31_04480 [Francisellaceae bacterium CB299]